MIDLDHNATTPLDPRFLEARPPCLEERRGFPTSPCRFGTKARGAVVRERPGTIERWRAIFNVASAATAPNGRRATS